MSIKFCGSILGLNGDPSVAIGAAGMGLDGVIAKSHVCPTYCSDGCMAGLAMSRLSITKVRTKASGVKKFL